MTRRLRVLSSALALLLLSSAASPTTSENTSKSSTPAGASIETVRVALAQFDVVARDSKGGIVSGLTAQDFEVFENGVALELDAVDEWGVAESIAAPPQPAAPQTGETPQPPPASPPVAAGSSGNVERRSIIFLFDGLNVSTALKTSQVKKAAEAFARRHLGPGDLAAVYQVDTTLRALSGLTADPEVLAEAIHRVAWMPSSSFAEAVTESVLAYKSTAGASYMPYRLAAGALMNATVLDWQREHTYKTIQALGNVFEGLPGRRILVFLSAGFPMTTPGDIAEEQGGFTPAFRDLVKSLSRSGVAVYSIDLGDDLSVGDASRSIDWRAAVGKLGMDDSILTDLGLDPDFSLGSAGARRQSLGVMAGETGGRLLTHGDFDKAFEIIQEESTRFYRISCRVPEGRSDARYGKIVIRVKRPGVKVTARRGRYGDVIPGAATLSPVGEKSNVVESLERFRSIAVRGCTSVLPLPDPEGAVPVVVVAEALGPIDYPSDGKGGAKVDLDYFVVARAGGEVIRSFSRTLKAVVKPEGAGSLRQTFRLEGRIALRPGVYELQAIVRIASPPQYGSWTTSLVVPKPAPSDGSLHLAGLILLPPGDEKSPLILRADSAQNQSDPLELSNGMRVLPATQREYPSSGELMSLFWLQGLVVPAGGKPDFQLTVKVLDAQGAERAVPSRLLLFQPVGTSAHRGLVSVDLSSLDEGAYVLSVQARTREASAASTEAKVPFQVLHTSAEAPHPAAAGSS